MKQVARLQLADSFTRAVGWSWRSCIITVAPPKQIYALYELSSRGDFGRRHQRGHSLAAVFACRYLARQGAAASADINDARRAAANCPIVARKFGRTYTTRADDLRTGRGRGRHYHGPAAWNGVVKRH